MNPRPVLITGATGLLGRALLDRLRGEDVSVRVLARSTTPALSDLRHVSVVSGSVADTEAVERAIAGTRVVYHLAAATGGGPDVHDRDTVGGTRNIVDACITHGVERLVYVSSLGVLDNAGWDRTTPVTEDYPVDPNPPARGSYTRAKLAAERVVREAIASRHLRAVILRPGQIISQETARRPPNATMSLGPLWVAVGPESQMLPLINVKDVADALALAASRPDIDGRTFHVVDPDPVSHEEYLAWCRRHGAPPTIRVSEPTLLAVATVAELLARAVGRQSPLTRARVRSLRPLARVDITAAHRELGWTPRVGVRSVVGEKPPSHGSGDR